MDVFVRLADVTIRQNKEGDLPDHIVPLLLKVAENPQDFAGKEAMVERLIEEVDEYEIYSNVSCGKVGFSLEDIQRTLDQIQAG